MRLTDYFPISKCPLCGVTIWIPRVWTGRSKDGTMKDAPRTKSCRCEVKGGDD